MEMVAVGHPQTLMLFPELKLLRDTYLNINKGVCSLVWVMVLALKAYFDSFSIAVKHLLALEVVNFLGFLLL